MKTAQITIEPGSAVLGAVVSGIDLRDADDLQIATLRRAVVEHGVVFLRDQPLTDDEHLALARRFGVPAHFPVNRLLGNPGNPLGYIVDSAESPPDADGWHTDITWIEMPPDFAFLQAIDIPERGGDTMWACLHAAYDALSPAMRQIFRKLRVRHQVAPAIIAAFRARAGAELAARIVDAFPPVSHPLVRTHPESGRDALFVSGTFMIGIDGMTDAESRMLLDFLAAHIQNPNFHVRWSWQPGDLAIWDERRTNHRALSDHYPRDRRMRRCTVEGDRPVLVEA